MRIESLAVKNYRCFRDVSLADLPPMTVVVGANGSGKSTLFDVFGFLKDALARNVADAAARRGGYRELVSRGEDGHIGIVVKFRERFGRILDAMRRRVPGVDGAEVKTTADGRIVLRFQDGAFKDPFAAEPRIRRRNQNVRLLSAAVRPAAS